MAGALAEAGVGLNEIARRITTIVGAMGKCFSRISFWIECKSFLYLFVYPSAHPSIHPIHLS